MIAASLVYSYQLGHSKAEWRSQARPLEGCDRLQVATVAGKVYYVAQLPTQQLG
jgi:hypothetical protein